MITYFLVSVVISWAFWRLVRGFIFSTPLDNLPGPAGETWLNGSVVQQKSVDSWDFHRNIAQNYGSVARVKGLFGANDIYVHDPKALHHILVKDQYIWEETDSFVVGNQLILGEGIFTSRGDKHRRQRKLLNPVFSINHMRDMVPIFYDVSYKVQLAFHEKVKNGPVEFDVLAWMTRLALELIGQSGMGYSFDELTENSYPHRYAEAAKSMLPLRSKSTPVAVWALPYLAKIGSARFRRFIVDRLPFKDIRALRDVVDVFHETSLEIFESKKKALEKGDDALAAQIGKGKDIISILMKTNMKAAEEDKLDEEELLGQINSIIFAATDTTSGALARTLYLLSQHKDAQARLRAEIRKARDESGGADINYDTLVSLPFLDAVCRETLRLHPPVPITERVAFQDTVLPLSEPIKGINGTYLAELHVPKGTMVTISIINSNRNTQLWGLDAEEWKPERWLNPLPQALVDAHIPGVYSHLLTFIGGGRSCLGFKFSQLEMKVALALLLESFEFSLSSKQIVWQMNGITTPNTDMNSTIPTLPLVVSKAG